MKAQKPRRNERTLVWRHTQAGLVIYDYRNGGVFHLNESAALVWQLCDGRHTTAAIARKLGDYWGEHCLPADIWSLIEELADLSLVELPHGQDSIE